MKIIFLTKNDIFVVVRCFEIEKTNYRSRILMTIIITLLLLLLLLLIIMIMMIMIIIMILVVIRLREGAPENSDE